MWRVNQAGYEAGSAPHRAYLMATAAETGAEFRVVDTEGRVAYQSKIGELLGSWAHSEKLSFRVYALDFEVPCGHSYTISVAGPVAATSPKFAVDRPEVLYPGLLLNSLFFYETQRDGADFIPNALRSAPGHLRDKGAEQYLTPPLNGDDYIDNKPPAKPLTPAGLGKIDAEGGWWDAGDYEKYVETMSYTAALMQIGVRDFPGQMGGRAPRKPPAPPNAVSYAGESGAGAPVSADFSDEARFGVSWLLKMWNDSTKTLAYQVDNTQDWNYYGEGEPSSTGGYCGGTYNSPYCLITEYDVWTLPQAADNLKANRMEAMRSDAASLGQDLGRRTQTEVFAIARRALQDLAAQSLDERATDVFVAKLRAMDPGAKALMAQSLNGSPATVRSAFNLPEAQHQSIQTAVNESFSADVRLQFQTAPDLVSGIELVANGQKLSWNIADYLAKLEKSVEEVIKVPVQAVKTGTEADATGKADATAGSGVVKGP